MSSQSSKYSSGGSIRQRRLNQKARQDMSLSELAELAATESGLEGNLFKAASGDLGGSFTISGSLEAADNAGKNAPTGRGSALKQGTFDYMSFEDTPAPVKPVRGTLAFLNDRLLGIKTKLLLTVAVLSGLVVGVPIGDALNGTHSLRSIANLFEAPASTSGRNSPIDPEVMSAGLTQKANTCVSLKTTSELVTGSALVEIQAKMREFCK